MTTAMLQNGHTRAHMALIGEASNQKRAAKARFKKAIKVGRVDFAEIARTRPEEIADMALVDVLRLLPAFGSAKFEKLGSRAARANINLLVSVSRASSTTLNWVVEHLPGTNDKSVEPAACDVGDAVLRKRLERVEGERDEALRALADAEMQLGSAQMRLGPIGGGQRDAFEVLADAVRRHRQMVVGPAPVADFGRADDVLWGTLQDLNSAEEAA